MFSLNSNPGTCSPTPAVSSSKSLSSWNATLALVSTERDQVVQDLTPVSAACHGVDAEQHSLDNFLPLKTPGGTLRSDSWLLSTSTANGGIGRVRPSALRMRKTPPIWADDVNLEESGRVLFERSVRVEGETAHGVRDRDCFPACVFEVHAFGLIFPVPGRLSSSIVITGQAHENSSRHKD